MADAKKATLLPEMSTGTKRSLAKAGMAVAMGSLVATGLMETDRNRTLKKVHIWSGVALVGFSCWHYSLYNKKPGRA